MIKNPPKYLDYLTLESISYSSQLEPLKAEKLSQEIDQKIWLSIQSRILGGA
jgi:hypothetical protein